MISEKDLDALMDKTFFYPRVERLGGEFWYRIYEADTAPGSPYVLPDGREAHSVYNYSRELRFSKLVEDELERRGLFYRYILELIKILSPGTPIQTTPEILEHRSVGNVIKLCLKATPYQRCLAALAAVGVDPIN